MQEIKIKKYLGETIKYIIKESKGKKRILIISPMKSGKTTTIRMLKEIFKEELGLEVTIVVISPKRTLQEMLVSDLGYEKVCGEYPYSNYKASKKDVVTTPDSSYKVFNELNSKNINYIVVSDEIHTMYLHASFRPKLALPKAYLNSKNLIKYIGLTATGDFIPNTEFDKRILVNPTEKWKFTNSVEVVDYTSKNNLIENALIELQEGIKEYKQVVFRHNDKEVLIQIKKELKALGVNCLLFSSDEFKNDEELNKYIAKRKRINYQVILTTSCTDEGVELLTNDSNVLLIATYNENSCIVDIIQHFGRYRNGTKKCKIICSKFAKGSSYEDRKKELEQYSKLCLKFSIENSKAFDTRFIRTKKEGFEIKGEVILEECIKADLNYKVNTIDKMLDYLKQHYLLENIEVIRTEGKENKCELKKTLESISKAKEEEKRIKENESINLNIYMTKNFLNLTNDYKTIFFKKECDLWPVEEKKVEELEPYYSLFWNENNKEKRKYYRELLEEKGKNELQPDEEIINILYNSKNFKEFVSFRELKKVRELKPNQITEIAEKIKLINNKELGKKEKTGILIRHVLRAKAIKQGRITNNDIENIKSVLKENKLITKRQLERKKELDRHLNSLIENIYSLESNGNRISCIKKSFLKY